MAMLFKINNKITKQQQIFNIKSPDSTKYGKVQKKESLKMKKKRKIYYNTCTYVFITEVSTFNRYIC